MASLEPAVAVLDRQLTIRVWNPRCEDLWGLRSDEVVGESFVGLDIGLPVDELWGPIRSCLDGGPDETTLGIEARDRRGRDFLCRVRCTPFWTDESSPSGVVVVMQDERPDGEAQAPAPRRQKRQTP
jgi:two-component system CheB/CheR fusion protein